MARLTPEQLQDLIQKVRQYRKTQFDFSFTVRDRFTGEMNDQNTNFNFKSKPDPDPVILRKVSHSITIKHHDFWNNVDITWKLHIAKDYISRKDCTDAVII
jgi:hypothetical protein